MSWPQWPKADIGNVAFATNFHQCDTVCEAWVDILVERLKDSAEQRTQVLVAAERVRILEYQEKRVTQRVNLFDKILIPNARKNIQRIQIYLGDAERAAVVRSKLAKAKQAKQRSAMLQLSEVP